MHNFMVKSKDNTSNRNLCFMNSNQIYNAVVFDKMIETCWNAIATEQKQNTPRFTPLQGSVHDQSARLSKKCFTQLKNNNITISTGPNCQTFTNPYIYTYIIDVNPCKSFWSWWEVPSLWCLLAAKSSFKRSWCLLEQHISARSGGVERWHW